MLTAALGDFSNARCFQRCSSRFSIEPIALGRRSDTKHAIVMTPVSLARVEGEPLDGTFLLAARTLL
jgi:hypothetical protein